MASLGEYLVGSVPFAGETLREFSADVCEGVCTATASMGALRPMDGIASGVGSATAAISDLIDVGGSIFGVGTTGDAQANALCSITVDPVGVGEAFVDLHNLPGLRVEIAGAAIVDPAALCGVMTMSMQASGAGEAVADMAAIVPIALAAAGQADSSASIAACRPFEVSASGFASVGAEIVALRPMAGEISGESSCSAVDFSNLATIQTDEIDCSGDAFVDLALIGGMLAEECDAMASADIVLYSQQSMTVNAAGAADVVASLVGLISMIADSIAGIGRADLTKIRARTAAGGERVDVDTSGLTPSPVEFDSAQGEVVPVQFELDGTESIPTIDIIASEVSGATISVDSVGTDRPTIQIRGVF